MKRDPEAVHKEACARQDEGALLALYDEAMVKLHRAHGLPPLEATREVDVAERAVVSLRDCLIERLRAEPSGPEAPRWRAALGRVNRTLSLVASVEYPAAGLHRETLEQAWEYLGHGAAAEFEPAGGGSERTA